MKCELLVGVALDNFFGVLFKISAKLLIYIMVPLDFTVERGIIVGVSVCVYCDSCPGCSIYFNYVPSVTFTVGRV